MKPEREPETTDPARPGGPAGPNRAPAPDGVGAAQDGQSAPLPPLHVSALVVSKANLVAALQIYVPQLVDVAMLDDDRFILTIGPPQPATTEKETPDG